MKRNIILIILVALIFLMDSSLTAADETKGSSSKANPVKAQLADLTAAEAAQMIKSGEITSVELVTALLDRIKEFEELNAFISIDKCSVMEQAKQADLMVRNGGSLGKLHGVPVAIKDNIDVKGLPTSGGTPALAYNCPKDDAEIVKILEKEGAIIIGKSNLHELVFGITSINKYFGVVKNPYDKNCFPGGSSGGNGAAVSARLVPVGIGTDTGGSIRIPSGLCGIYGYRPSVGRYSTDGIIPMSSSRDTAGPMARSVEDLILIDSVVKNYDPDKIQAADLKNVRLGVPRGHFYNNMDNETAKLVENALEKLEEHGVTLVEADMHNIGELDRKVDFPRALYECKRDLPKYLKEYDISLETVVSQIASPDVKESFDRFVMGEEAVTKETYKEAMNEHLPKLIEAYESYFANNNVDGIIFPTTILPARPIEGAENTVELNGEQVPTFPTYIQNTSPGANAEMAGVSLPIGLTTGGLPVSIEIDMLPNNDKKLLSVSLALQEIFGKIPPPEGFKL